MGDGCLNNYQTGINFLLQDTIDSLELEGTNPLARLSTADSVNFANASERTTYEASASVSAGHEETVVSSNSPRWGTDRGRHIDLTLVVGGQGWVLEGLSSTPVRAGNWVFSHPEDESSGSMPLPLRQPNPYL